MPKKGWTKYKCQFCSVDIKCNARLLGAKKVQLEQHEKFCPERDDTIISKTSYLITDSDIANMKTSKKTTYVTKPKKLNLSKSKTINKINKDKVAKISDEIYNMTLDNLKYKSFSELPNIYLWDLNNGLYQPYCLYNQNVINRCIENKITKISIIEVKYSSCLKFNNVNLHIEINIDSLKQRIVKRGNTPIDYSAFREVKIIQNIPGCEFINTNDNFGDPVQRIPYCFKRSNVPNYMEDCNILESSITGSDVFYLKSIVLNIPNNFKVHKIFKIQNDIQRKRYVNCMKDLYSHVKYNDTENKFQETDSIDKDVINSMQKEIIGSPGKNFLHTGIVPNEVIVFHGCYESGLINSICETGFNPFLCNNSLYGHGIYMSRTFDYCANNGYAADLGENIFHLFVCRLVTGSYCNGSQGQRIPNLLTKTKRCKTMVNSIEAPEIYAVQDPSQIEILYEIHFTFTKECEVNYNIKESFT